MSELEVIAGGAVTGGTVPPSLAEVEKVLDGAPPHSTGLIKRLLWNRRGPLLRQRQRVIVASYDKRFISVAIPSLVALAAYAANWGALRCEQPDAERCERTQAVLDDLALGRDSVADAIAAERPEALAALIDAPQGGMK
jgi:hypothetical protein